MQFPTDTDLAAAQQATVRRINGKLEFDWNRNGLYDHAYSDLSLLAVSVTLDDSKLNSQLPAEIQSITGYSSAELRVTLFGKRQFPELGASALFMPIKTTDPLYALTLDGTPVRYSRYVRTTGGRKTLRQFTGFLRSWNINRKTSNVQLVCSDISDVQANIVTLPHIAVTQNVYSSVTDPSPFARPWESTWVYEEILRQAGRPTGPPTRSDAAWYMSCNGSMIPSVGSYWSLSPTNGLHGIWLGAADPWQDGKYGICPVPVPDPIATSQSAFFAGGTTSKRVVMSSPDNDSLPDSFAFGMWHLSDGTATIPPFSGLPVRVVFLQMLMEAQSGQMSFKVLKNGQLQWTMNDAAYGNSGGASGEYWQQDFVAQTAGWHYHWFEIRFGPVGPLTTVYRVDGVVQSVQSQSFAAGPYRYIVPDAQLENNINLVQVLIANPCQHIQLVYNSAATGSAYVAGQQDPPLRDGRPLAYVSRSRNYLNWMPDVYQQKAWDALTAVSAGELGAVYTDVWGGIHCVPHTELQQDVNTGFAGAITITEDQLQDYTMSPSLDARRNSITISAKQRNVVSDIVYAPSDSKQFHTLTNTTTENFISLDEVISVDTNRIGLAQIISATKPLTPYDKFTTVSSAILDQDFTTDATVAHTGWYWECALSKDQRTLSIYRDGGNFAPGGNTGVYIGSYLGGNDVSMQIAGTKYSDPIVTQSTLINQSSINRNGRRVLILDDNDWRQDVNSTLVIAGALLSDTATPKPIIDGIVMRANPQMEKRDIYKVQIEGIANFQLYVQVLGVTRSDTLTESTDKPVFGVVVIPGGAVWDDPASGWDVGSWSD